jgi:hypothetical protein
LEFQKNDNSSRDFIICNDVLQLNHYLYYKPMAYYGWCGCVPCISNFFAICGIFKFQIKEQQMKLLKKTDLSEIVGGGCGADAAAAVSAAVGAVGACASSAASVGCVGAAVGAAAAASTANDSCTAATAATPGSVSCTPEFDTKSRFPRFLTPRP